MSLILDALRKSEAERRRGNLPALALELPPPPPRAVPARAWWLAIPVALVLAAGAFWMTRPVDAPPPVPPVMATPAPADPVPTPVPAAPQLDPAPRPAPRPAPASAAETPAVSAPAVATPEVHEAGDVPVFALADLTADERRALPPLKLSMHMWAPAPANRFVILDGHRLAEGDRAGNAVVARIDPDGVILAADGRRIRLPLP